ncbi:MAG: flippase activity-associated protein Agl23 [Candidatus Aminicenantales bacterium]|jgi:uncharacterized protein (TIGR03663 family)
MKKAAFGGLFLAVFGLGLALRLARLDLRPIHHDEANQALKFAALLEKGEYRYDPAEHHGPTLYYLTLPLARARGQKTLASLDETTLRLLPALFGAGLVLLFLLLRRELGRDAILAGALLAALSPALTYFSRFYIQESLFAFFAWAFLIAAGKTVRRPCFAWAITAGIAAGLLYATKETSILVFAAAGAGILIASVGGKKRLPLEAAQPAAPDAALRAGCRPEQIRALKLSHVLAGTAAALSTAFLFYSSFFRNPKGIVDSLAAFKDYFARGTESGLHTQPWDTYLKTLLWTKSEGVVWTEALILGLALIGMAAAFLHRKRRTATPVGTGPAGPSEGGFWPIYLSTATIVLAAAYSAIPYKTPWNIVVFLAGFALLAGYGASALLRAIRPAAGRAVLILLILAGAAQLERQNLRAQFVYPADPRNPYAYAQTSPDFLRLVIRLRGLADVHRHGRDMLVKVVTEPDEQWPLPWYLRDFRRVGYWTSLAAAGGTEDVPVVIASQHYADVLEQTAGNDFQIEYYGLRPGTLLAVFIDHKLWEKYINRKSDSKEEP